MLTEYQKKSDNYQEILRNYLNILLMKIFRLRPKFNTAINDYGTIVMDYLAGHSLSDEININSIARSAFLSPRSFRNLFKKGTGKSLSSYIMELRIARAKDLLENTDLPILAVMNEVGYKDSKFFYEIFERFTGTTPGHYRKGK